MKNNITKDIMREEYAKEICTWKYEGQYSIYNMPSYEEAKELGYGITKRENYNNYVCYLEDNKLIAYTQFKKINNKRIYMGIGLIPEYTGKGMGNYFLVDSINYIKDKFEDYTIYLEVRSFNERAIKAYEKVGFHITKKENKLDRFGKKEEFVIMEY